MSSPRSGASRSSASPLRSPLASAALSPEGTAQLEADVVNDADSAYGAPSVHSETFSLTSTVLRYRVENGRRYHGFMDGSYCFPNDEPENDRLDLQHNLMCLTFDDKLNVSPAGVENQLHRVLDAGTGTGIWALDFADEHPETEVLGIDLSPIQPNYVPPNLKFLVDDLESQWTHSAKFDLIYVRMLTGSLANWKRFLEQSFENINPGGWIELVDMGTPTSDDGTLPEDSFIRKWSNHMLDAATRIGRSMDTINSHPQHLRDAGFTRVNRVIYKWPMNTWPRDPKYKEIGAWAHENMNSGLQAFSLALFTRVLGWTLEEVEVFIASVRKELRNRNIHGYWPIVVTYGQKPL